MQKMIAQRLVIRKMKGERQGECHKIANMAFLCALLVVLIHVGPKAIDLRSCWGIAYYFMRHVLAVVAVPYFFVVSGYFLAKHYAEQGWWIRATRKRLATILVPFFIWNVIWLLLFRFVLPFVAARAGENSMLATNLHELVAMLGFNFFTMPGNAALWYLRSLFLFVLVSPILIVCVRKSRGLVLPIFFLVYLCVNPGHIQEPDFWVSAEWRDFWRYGISLEGLFYFSVGLYLRFWPLHLRAKTSTCVCAVAIVFALGRMILTLSGRGESGLLPALSIPIIISAMWLCVPTRRLLPQVLDCSFGLYCIHIIIVQMIDLGLKNLHLKSAVWVWFPEWLVAIAVSVLIVNILRRSTPGFSRVAFGGR